MVLPPAERDEFELFPDGSDADPEEEEDLEQIRPVPGFGSLSDSSDEDSEAISRRLRSQDPEVEEEDASEAYPGAPSRKRPRMSTSAWQERKAESDRSKNVWDRRKESSLKRQDYFSVHSGRRRRRTGDGRDTRISDQQFPMEELLSAEQRETILRRLSPQNEMEKEHLMEAIRIQFPEWFMLLQSVPKSWMDG